MEMINVLDQFKLTNRRALITGGSKGLVKVMATALAQAGADVAISSRHYEECRAAGVVRNLAAADFVEAGDLVEELGDFGPAVPGEELHQRAGELVCGDGELLECLLDRRLRRGAH